VRSKSGYGKIDPSALTPPPEVVEGEQMNLTAGFHAELSPREMPLNASPDLANVRFEETGIRKDFGYRPLGSAAASRVLGLVEHKFIEDDQQFQRLVRLTRSGTGKLFLEVWDGAAWLAVDTSEEDVDSVYLSTLSIQGVLAIADGKTIWKWVEEPAVVEGGNNFPAGNLLDAPDETTVAVIDPAEGIDNSYTINYKVTAEGASTSGITIEVGILFEGLEVAERTYVSNISADPGFSQTWEDSFELVQEIESGEEVGIILKSVQGTSAGLTTILLEDSEPGDIAAGVYFAALKGGVAEAYDDKYKFVLEVTYPPANPGAFEWSRIHVKYFYKLPAGAWTQVGGTYVYTSSLEAGEVAVVEHEIMLNGAVANTKFGIFTEIVVGGDEPDGSGVGDGVGTPPLEVQYREATGGVLTGTVHGYNPADGDADFGVAYSRLGEPTSALTPISPDAPGGRYIAQFARRIVALRDGGDVQSFAWTVDGDVTDWIGEGSGQIYLVETGVDAIDPLMGFAKVGDGMGALFRERSIWRVFESGNLIQWLGAVSWIEGVGTRSPFSIQNTNLGVVFLGHDLMVYLLLQQGNPVRGFSFDLTPVGAALQPELVRVLTSNLDLVDSAYDSVLEEYILGIPENGSQTITALWTLSLREMIGSQQPPTWRKRPVQVQRLAATSSV
jgi:hypothetical protein